MSFKCVNVKKTNHLRQRVYKQASKTHWKTKITLTIFVIYLTRQTLLNILNKTLALNHFLHLAYHKKQLRAGTVALTTEVEIQKHSGGKQSLRELSCVIWQKWELSPIFVCIEHTND